jgi:PAS domain S-box-containing protein
MTQIVIVDDRKTNLRILKQMTQAFEPGAEIETFSDTEAAMDWLAQHPADLVITDFKMPKYNGAEFTRWLRAEIPDFDAPIVVITAYEDTHYRYEALEAGATDFLLSPIDHREFRTRIRNLLAMRMQRQLIKSRAITLEQALNVALREHERTIEDSERKLRLILDSSPNIIVVTDQVGRVVTANRAFGRLCGAETAATAAGRRLAEIVPDPAFVAAFLEGDGEVARTMRPADTPELAFRAPKGPAIVFQIAKTPILAGGQGRCEILTVATDITPRKQAELAMGRAKEAAELSNRSKSQFLASMSHELRTPLNAIIGFADMIASELLGPVGKARYREYAEDISFSANRLLRILSDILLISQIDTGDARLYESEVDVVMLIDDVIRLCEPRATERAVTVRRDIPPGLPLVRGDEGKLKQVLSNLLINAATYTPLGGDVVVGARPAAHGGLAITIRDNGPGMTQEQLASALKRFTRGEAAHQTRPGIGLGLPLSQELVAMHGGTLHLESRIGEGTVATVELPAGRCLRPLAAERQGR